MTIYSQYPHTLSQPATGSTANNRSPVLHEGKVLCNCFSDGRSSILSCLRGGGGIKAAATQADANLRMNAAFSQLILDTEDVKQFEGTTENEAFSEVVVRWRNGLDFVLYLNNFNEELSRGYMPLKKALAQAMNDPEKRRLVFEVLDALPERREDGGFKYSAPAAVLRLILNDLRRERAFELAPRTDSVSSVSSLRRKERLAALAKLPGDIGPKVARYAGQDVGEVMAFFDSELGSLKSDTTPEDRTLMFHKFIKSLLYRTELVARPGSEAAEAIRLAGNWEMIHDILDLCRGGVDTYVQGRANPLIMALAESYEENPEISGPLIAVWDYLPVEKCRVMNQALKQAVHFSMERGLFVTKEVQAARQQGRKIDEKFLRHVRDSYTLHRYAGGQCTPAMIAKSARKETTAL